MLTFERIWKVKLSVTEYQESGVKLLPMKVSLVYMELKSFLSTGAILVFLL